MKQSRFAYPVALTPDEIDGGFVVTCSDIPEAITQGDTMAEALEMAQDAIRTAMGIYMRKKENLPLPSKPKKSEVLIFQIPLVTAKLAVYQAMREQNLSSAELAERLGWEENQIQRLLDLYHQTRLDIIEAALIELGKRLLLTIVDAA